ncbi:MAG: nucleoside-triphosphatase [Bacteroidota bacterium]
MIFLLTGESGSGKTTLLNELVLIFSNYGIKAGGFTAFGMWEDGERSGFTLHDILNGKDYPLARTEKPGSEMLGRFTFDEETLLLGNRLLQEQSENPLIDIIIIDEVGPLEIKGGGWAPSIGLLSGSQKHQLWVVRPWLVEQVPERWKFLPGGIFPVSANSAASVFSTINGVMFPEKDGSK